MTLLQFYLSKIKSMLWVRPVLLSGAAIFWIIFASLADKRFPEKWTIQIEKETLVDLFTILATTMLTVATFSVSAVASAFASVASSASPRATRIVMSDTGVQSTLASFLAAFIYALVSITALSGFSFGRSGRFVLFVGFVAIVAWVLMSFLRWVDRVSRLGKLGDTLDRVSLAARETLSNPQMVGPLGGRPLSESNHEQSAGLAWFPEKFGYIQYINMEELQKLAEELKTEIVLQVRPGSLVTKNIPIGKLYGGTKPDDEVWRKLQRCLAIDNNRNETTDPRFAMILMAEVADRALSPAVNDPGTAIEVLSIQTELFHIWATNDLDRKVGQADFDRIFAPCIAAEDLVFDAFHPIARDGSAMVEVGMRLQKALWSIMHLDHEDLRQAADGFRQTALEYFEHGLLIESQRQRVRELARRELSRD
ncbi:DUF2254 domain-containing protein [Luteolibacter pohnpeiensis]|uniref:DUF2254 domain-containing protein n=1 Tax=Luteolibacter pohnpeiensis TaxID=454153 RepID=A0A934VPQ0_9BACT|nr:DUF2254 domain-containing protein [Luteolibacter pohnpeiensis]MBK1881256.1 DUF2254 domain-containing protein [Luteolibacter pohnpeiensis]